MESNRSMARDWKVVTLDIKTRAPLHEEWDTVHIRPDGWIELQLIEKGPSIGDREEKVCVKRRWYPPASILYIEEMGLKKSAQA